MNKPPETAVLEPVDVYCLLAAGGPETFANAFQKLEAIVPLKGHKFYGVYNPNDGSYRACAVALEGDIPEDWQLERYTIPGGEYAYRKIHGEHDELTQQIPSIFEDMKAGHTVDPERPYIEFYKRLDEFRLYLPIKR